MRRLFASALILLSASLAWAEPAWWQAPAGPAYQVLVYSFADGNGDGWGDFAGLTHRLDALEKLGVTALWLSPIHPAGSYHGYDVIDYKAVNPTYGTLEDFDTLVAEAHDRGIHILLDMVFNHTSSRHAWFRSHPDWYITKKDGVTYGGSEMGTWYPRSDGQRYYGTFWDQMPDLDLTNPEVVAELKSTLRFWLDHGVDGFRFDAAKEIFQTGKMPQGFPVVAKSKEFWNSLRDDARSVNPNVYFVAEVNTTSNQEIAAYAGCFDGLFDFPQAKALVADLTATGNSPKLVSSLAQNYRLYGRSKGFVPAPFLSNHDQDRSMSVALAKYDAPDLPGLLKDQGEVAAVSAAKAAALTRFKQQALFVEVLPGLPYIYYGEELGLTGRRYKNDDIGRRDAFPWGGHDAAGATVTWTKKSNMLEAGQNRLTATWADQALDPDSLLNWYWTIGELRKDHPALRSVSFTACPWTGAAEGNVAAFFREGGGEKLLAAFNFTEAPQTLEVPAGTKLTPVLTLGTISGAAATVTLAPGTAVLWTVTGP